MNKLLPIFLCTLLSSQMAFAKIAGEISSAQFPGWVERGETILAIKPGLSIEEGDVVRTGDGGKVKLRLNDGSDIKLGNVSHIKINTVKESKPENDNVFGLALDVLKGVFRFTTSAIGQSQKRDVAISFGTVTAGVRGTDIWGRVNDEKDLVCLIEGKIDVSHPQSDTVRLDQPRQYYDAAKESAGSLKGKVDLEQLTQWASLTEPEISEGLMTKDGQWSVVVMSLKDKEYAQDFSNSLNKQGYPAEVVSAEINKETYYRVIIKQFKGKNDAVYAQKRLAVLNNINSPWVKKYSF